MPSPVLIQRHHTILERLSEILLVKIINLLDWVHHLVNNSLHESSLELFNFGSGISIDLLLKHTTDITEMLIEVV